MNTEELVEQNNQLRKQLNPENKTYYEEILVYIRVNINKKEKQTEELLLEMLQDILNAQKNGTSAQVFFGKNPKEISDAILAELPNNSSKDLIKFVMMVFILLLQFNLFTLLLEPVIAVSLFKTGLPILLLALAIIFILASVKYSLFSKKVSYSFALSAFMCWLATFLVPIIDNKMNGIGKTVILSHQLFALILLLLSGIILVGYYLEKSSSLETIPTVILAVLAFTIFIGLVNPATLSLASKMLFSTLLLLIMFVLPSIQFYRQEKKN
ncbi:DUF1129 family protein [Enterococcus plantarum]|uniref:DUF1129 family protein n=1 Tax=Enterococcus plantarum TaxID=1077675 RepID=UPI001A8FBE91|nr:DUF1129 family protein [Enterococcus plantarum]MBO0467884.1 DUF1129 family protein [Enterococcus plantarum]